MVRTRSTSSSAAANQEAPPVVPAAPVAPVAARGRGKGKGKGGASRGQSVRGRGENAGGNQGQGRAAGQAQAPPQQAAEEVHATPPPSPPRPDQNQQQAEKIDGILNVLESLVPPTTDQAAPNHAPAQDPYDLDDDPVDFLDPQYGVPQPNAPANVDRPLQAPAARVQPNDFLKLKPHTFTGVDPSAEPMLFLEEVEELFIALGCLQTQATQLIGFVLKNIASAWWRNYKKGRGPNLPPISWPRFKDIFMKKFLPSSKQDDMRRQFEQLKQGTISVEEYENEFNRLAEHAPLLIPTVREQVRRLVEGLNPYMARDLASHIDDKSYLDIVDIAKRKESFDRVIKESREASKKAKTSGNFSGQVNGGRNRNQATQSQSVAYSSPYQAPVRYGKQGGNQAQRRQGRGQTHQGNSSASQSRTVQSYPLCSTCQRRHLGPCRYDQKGCFHCNDLNHHMKNCPLLTHATGKAPAAQAHSTASTFAAPPARTTNNQSGRGIGRGGTQTEGGPARLFTALDRQNATASNTVITGVEAAGDAIQG